MSEEANSEAKTVAKDEVKVSGVLDTVAGQVTTRGAKGEDLNFILSTWLKSYKDSDFGRSIPNEIFFSFHQSLIRKIIGHEHNAVTILCAPEDPNQIIGYIVYNTKAPIVFFTYMKFSFRRLGLAKMLFNKVKEEYVKDLELPADHDGKPLMVQCTHKFKVWGEFARKYNLLYNPYIVTE